MCGEHVSKNRSIVFGCTCVLIILRIEAIGHASYPYSTSIVVNAWGVWSEVGRLREIEITQYDLPA